MGLCVMACVPNLPPKNTLNIMKYICIGSRGCCFFPKKAIRGFQRGPATTKSDFHAGGKTKATTMSSVEAVDKDVKTRRTATLFPPGRFGNESLTYDMAIFEKCVGLGIPWPIFVEGAGLFACPHFTF